MIFFQKYFKRDLLKQVCKYIVVGIINTAISYLLFAFLLAVDVHYLFANPISYAVGMLSSFFLNKYWTFVNFNKKVGGQLLRFIIVNLLACVSSFCVLWLLCDMFSIPPLLGQISSMVFSLGVNFLGNKLCVFAK